MANTTPARKSRRPRDPKWAALRQWHREQRAEWLKENELCEERHLPSTAAYCYGKATANDEALKVMNRITRQHGRKEIRG